MCSDNSDGFTIVDKDGDKDGAAHLSSTGAHNSRVSDNLFKASIKGWFDEC
jgi:hypothetical protein